jgi:hypothetical protein
MNATEAINNIVKLLGLQFKKENFSSTFLVDGTTEVTNNSDGEVEVGQTLFIVKDGTLVPAPMGEHETRDGFIVSLDGESTIIAIAKKDQNMKTEVNTEDDSIMEYTKATDAQGQVLESKTFDVGEAIEVVAEDGTKTPAPDGTHELSLTDESGNENLIKVIVKDGLITERENVELEMVPVEDIPQSGNEDKENVMPDSKGQVKDGTQGSVKAAEQTDTSEPLPEDTESTDEAGDDTEGEVNINLTKLAYRISELEARLVKCEEAMVPPVNSEVTEEEAGIKMEEEELPKLDGAPTETAQKFSQQTNNKSFGKNKQDFQSSFLSKLYK